MNPHLRKVMVELEITDINNREFSFVSNKELDKAARIVSVESFHADLVAYTPTQKTVVPKAVHNKTYLQLVDSAGTTLQTIPLSTITVDAARNVVSPINLDGFDMQQSKVILGETTGAVSGNKFLFLFTYIKKAAKIAPSNDSKSEE